jgi:hypothetical protein
VEIPVKKIRCKTALNALKELCKRVREKRKFWECEYACKPQVLKMQCTWMPEEVACIRVVQFGVQSKVRVCKLSRILTNPKNDVCELLKVCQSLCPFIEILAEGVTWGQKWYGFGMLLGYGSPNLHVSSSALLCRFQCSWAWNGPVRATCLSSRGVNPTFWAAICCI